MAQQIINISAPNDNLGDPLRTAFDKTNDNFIELYGAAIQPTYFVFAGGTFRIAIRGGAFCIDQTITLLGFGGAQDTDWEELQSFKRV